MTDSTRIAYNQLTLRAVVALKNGPRGVREIFKIVRGHNESIVCKHLQKMERDGFLQRHTLPGPGRATAYSLSPLGRDLLKPAEAMLAFVARNKAEILAARERHQNSAEESDKRAAFLAKQAAAHAKTNLLVIQHPPSPPAAVRFP
jgi:DNA-binding HxlR family transcriptional regulator